MKKSQIFTIATCGIAAVVLTCILIIGMKNDWGALAESGPKTFVNEVKYDPEEAELTSVDLFWVDGEVKVGLSSDGQIHVIERSDRALKDDEKMEASVSSGKLKVSWDGQWFNKWIHLGWFQYGGKELEVQLPAETAAGLSELKVSTTSGDVEVAKCPAAAVSLSSTSGDLVLLDCPTTEEASASTVSGDIAFDDVTASDKVKITTTSGSISATNTNAAELEVDTTSGDCQYEGSANQRAKVNTISGEISLNLAACPGEASMSSVSGDLRLEMAQVQGFTMDYSAVSGEFYSDFPGTQRTGERSGSLKYNGGTGAQLRMSTTSGDMHLIHSQG